MSPWFLSATFLLGGCTDPATTASDDSGPTPSTDTYDTGTLWLDVDVDLTVSENPNHPLSALVEVTTSEDIEVEVAFWAEGTLVTRTARSESGTSHSFTLIGMRAETPYSVQAIARGEEVGQAESEIRTVTTGPLPDVFVPFTVTLHNESQVQKGYTLLGPVGSKAYAFAVDEQGEIVWYHRSGGYDTTTIQRDMVLLEDGTLTSLLYLNTTADGELIQSLAFDTELDLDAHELVQGPDGSFATLTRDEQVFDGTALRGGGIVEAAPTGEVSFEWNAFDHLDTSRFPTYPSTSTTGSGALDWAHANAIQYLEEDNAYLLSLRNQNMVYKIDRATGEVIWSLGDDGDFTLTSGEWFYAQHGPHLLPDGRIAIYDNGNSRPDTDKAFSRGVIYQLDEDAMTAEQVWEYRTDYYTGRVGNIFILDNDNVLVCAGGPDPPVVDDKPAGVYEVTQGGEVVWSFEEFESTSDGESTPIIYRSRRLESFYPDGSRKRQ